MRILLMVLRRLYLVPFLWIKLRWYYRHWEDHLEDGFAHVKKIADYGIKGGNVEIAAEGLENIPEKSGFIYYPNHQGMFDVMVFLHISPVPFGFVSKIEVKDIPVLKETLKITRSEVIDRSDIKQSLGVINNIAKGVMEGRNYLLFAEGTRSRKGNEVLPFKGGSFKAAQKSKCPIVPVALVDSFIPFDERSIRKTVVKVMVLKPLYYEDYQNMKSVEIASEVQGRIREAIRQMQQES